MSDLKHVREYVFNQPWAIMPEMLDVIAEVVCIHLQGGTPSAAESLQPRKTGEMEIKRGIAIVPIMGVMMRRASLMEERFSGGISDWKIREAFNAAMASSARVVLLHLDSPGGEAVGMMDMAQMVYDAATKSDKLILNWTDRRMASRAYGIGSQANLVLATQDAIAGSIGVVAKVTDVSRWEKNEGLDSVVIRSGEQKAAGVGPITDAQLQPLREIVAQYAQGFYDIVERGRRMTLSEDIKTGRIYTGIDAQKNGLVDDTMTLEEIFQKYGTAE